MFLFTLERNIQCAKKVLRLAMEYRTVINKIVLTSPEAMVEFSLGKKLKLLTAVNLYSFERSRNFFLRRKQNYPITSHATTALCKECNQIRLYAERQPESRFRVMKVGRDVTVDDDGESTTSHRPKPGEPWVCQRSLTSFPLARSSLSRF